jgi:hypothetical protein
MRRVSRLWAMLALMAFPPTARAADPLFSVTPPNPNAVDITDVASSFDDNNKFDFRFHARYEHVEKRALLKRELEGLSPTQTAIQVFRDLAYESHRDQVSLRSEVGLWHDLMLSVELPIIIEQSQQYGFDQSAGAACSYPPAQNPSCVNAANSTTIADGIVPMGGYDAQNRGIATGGATVFRGVLRGARGGSGADAFDTLNVGLTWAPMSQARDDTKPTWVILVEGQFSIGTIQKFDRANPDGNHGVSEGVHRLFVRTAISKRIRPWFEPYWGLWYLLPIARDGSLYADYGPAEKIKNPMMQGGTVFGAAFVPIERRDKQYQLALDLRGRVDGHFTGRGYSEAWELFASSPVLLCDATTAPYNPACDPSQQNAYTKNPAYTGITTIQNYATVGMELAAQAQIGPFIRFRTAFNYAHDQSHLITGEDIGQPMNPTGRVTTASEFNPAYRPIIDLPGRRYRVDDVDVFGFNISAQVMF